MRALVFVLLVVTLARADEPSAPKARAHQLFKEGEAAYQQGRYDEAIDKYTDAYNLVPVPLLLFDLGQAHRMRGERDKAAGYYRKYLDVEPEGRGAVEAREHLDEFAAQIKREEDAKRAAEEAKKKADDDAARARAAEEAKKQAAVEEAQQQREHQAAAVLTAAPPPAKPPVWKRGWFWGAVGGAVVVVGVAVGVGVGVGGAHHSAEPTLRPVDF